MTYVGLVVSELITNTRALFQISGIRSSSYLCSSESDGWTWPTSFTLHCSIHFRLNSNLLFFVMFQSRVLFHRQVLKTIHKNSCTRTYCVIKNQRWLSLKNRRILMSVFLYTHYVETSLTQSVCMSIQAL